MKRKCLIMLSACLIAVIAFSALAEGALFTLYNSGRTLLLHTDNVTLHAHATFTYDGQLFKTLDGLYIQDADNSRMDVTLTTPQRNGGNRSGGYCVVANGDRVFVMESAYHGEFSQQHKPGATSVLSNDDMTNLLADLGGMAVNLAEGGLNKAVTVSRDGENMNYHLVLEQNNAPELLNKALSLVSKEIIDEYFYPYNRTLPFVTVDDRMLLMATLYEEMYGEPLEQEGAAEDQTDYMRYEAARQAMFECLEEIQRTAEHSVIIIHGADKSQTTYDSFNDYLIAHDGFIVHYEDYYQTQGRYALEHPDSASDMRTLRAWHKQILQENNCAGMIVEGDGSYILCYNDDELSRLAPFTQSVTQRICTQLEDVSLKKADVTVTLDNRNRLISFGGKLQMNITDFVGRTHVLTIDFDSMAGEYGTSKVALFDPKDYGIEDVYYQDDGTGNG